jgi:hypothetical protein
MRLDFLVAGIVSALAQFIFGKKFLLWLGSFVCDEKGHTSAKRFGLIFSITVAGLGAFLLVFAKAIYVVEHGGDTTLELAVLMLGASGTGASAYAFGKPSDRTKGNEPDA